MEPTRTRFTKMVKPDVEYRRLLHHNLFYIGSVGGLTMPVGGACLSLAHFMGHNVRRAYQVSETYAEPFTVGMSTPSEFTGRLDARQPIP
ncbi:hypothetical protein EVAR_67596_1 [Eumeta japonica]|uniref:Uncharacterized protein n=1 Tax=Eumeta variegata TaxID=151549 RepID=A0A4C2A4K0_EUMVA|nr:hypothetical protein EVAR_67596_1 [Eumeta japonica]